MNANERGCEPPVVSRPTGTKWDWFQGGVLHTVFLIACCLHMGLSMSPRATIENHPFSGPLLMVQTAAQPIEYAVGLLLWGLLSAGICLPAYRRNGWTIAASVVSMVAWIFVSLPLAIGAVV